MKIFVSWSGSYSRSVADLLRRLLPCMMQGLEVFVSQHDIESGARWTVRLAQELEQSNFGILCLSPDSLNSPWLLFEAGALTKHIEGCACGLLIGGLSPSDVSGPLSQFQHRSFTRDDFQHLITDVNKLLQPPLQADHLALIFEKWWPDLESGYAAVQSNPAPGHPEKRSQKDILDEVLARVRSLEREVQASSAGGLIPTPRGPVTIATGLALARDILQRLPPAQLQIVQSMPPARLQAMKVALPRWLEPRKHLTLKG